MISSGYKTVSSKESAAPAGACVCESWSNGASAGTRGAALEDVRLSISTTLGAFVGGEPPSEETPNGCFLLCSAGPEELPPNCVADLSGSEAAAFGC